MKKHIKQFATTILFISILFASCDEGFEEMNSNPNKPSKVDQTFLFTHAQRIPFGHGTVISEVLTHNFIWAQHLSDRDLNTDFYDRGRFEVENPQSFWNRYYNTETPNISDLLRRLEAEPDDIKATHTNRKAMVNILLAYVSHFNTDYFGGMPYASAFKAFDFADQDFTPTYDTQEMVYDKMLEQLSAAVEELTDDPQQDNFGVDIWFNGDIVKWKKFANSLKLRLAMRILDANETKAIEIINGLLSSPDQLISSNAENLIFNFENFESGYFGIMENRLSSKGAAKNLVGFLSGADDPRLRIFFSKATDGVQSGNHVGVPVSPDDRDAEDLFLNGNEYSGLYSLLQPNAWVNKRFPETVMTYSEVLLLRAEIAQKGLSTENAEQLYNEGIRASIDYYSQLYKDGNAAGGFSIDPAYNVSSQEIEDLLIHPLVKYNPADGENQIAVQQWIHHHKNPRELFSNFKRTDIPNATSTPTFELIVVNGVEIPRTKMAGRLSYPASEYALNEINVNEINKIQGADIELTKLWWDVK